MEQQRINKLITNPPTMGRYPKLKGEDKAIVDSIIADNLKSNPVLRVGKDEVPPKNISFWFLKWNDVINLQNHLSKNNFMEACKLVYNVSDKDILKTSMFNFFASYKWIQERIIEIVNAQNNDLSREPTPQEKKAGIEDLAQFEHYATLHNLTGGDDTKNEFYLDQEYWKIHRTLKLNKVKSTISEKLNKR